MLLYPPLLHNSLTTPAIWSYCHSLQHATAVRLHLPELPLFLPAFCLALYLIFFLTRS